MWKFLRRKTDFSAGHPEGTDGLCIYAVGDIHGRADLLAEICRRIDDDAKHRPPESVLQVFLGDYIDRGPASATVISMLAARSRASSVVCLRGNHETCLLDFLRNPDALIQWRQIGGLQTLMSYGLRPDPNPDETIRNQLASALLHAIPAAELEFLQSLPMSLQVGKYFFVHAGIRPGVALDQQRDEDLLWIRNDFLLCEDMYEKTIVHGHTPVREPEVLPNRINIDTGAYATGRLTCVRLQGNQIDFL